MDLPGNNQNVRAQNLKQITLEKQTTRYMFLLNNIYQSFIPLQLKACPNSTNFVVSGDNGFAYLYQIIG